jgi:hypothetical protein
VDDAFDTFRSQRVLAAAATASRFPDHYICPLCRTEVRLAAGPIVRKHFRHVRDTDHEECERYSKNFGREVPLSQHEYEHFDAVLVASWSQSNNGGRVALAVRFRPAKRANRSRLSGQVEFVSGGKSTSYIIQPGVRQQYFRIDTPEKSYLIKAKLSHGGFAQYPFLLFRGVPPRGESVGKQRVKADRLGARMKSITGLDAKTFPGYFAVS